MARRGEEKTIKVSADVADLQRAFENVEKAYADVSKASGDYARAVEASASAVTADEKAIAKEVERTSKAILTASKQRATAYKSQATAIKGQIDTVKKKVAVEKADKDASEKTSKASKGKAIAMAGAAVAVAGLAKAMSAAINISREMVGGMIASTRQGEENRAKLIALEKVYKDLDKAIIEGKKEITLIVAEFARFGALIDSSGPTGKAISWVTNEIKTLVKQGTLMAQLFGSMVFNMEGFDAAAKRLHALNKAQKEGEKTRDKSKESERAVKKLVEERVEVMKRAEQARKDEQAAQEAAAKSAADAARQARKDDEASTALLETEIAFAEAEAERLNAEKDLLDLREQTNKMIDETIVRLQQEMEIRHLEQTMREGESEQLQRQHEIELALFEIRTSGASEEEQARARRILQLQGETEALQKAAATAEKKAETDAAAAKATSKAATDAALGVGAAALEAAGVANAATAIEAGKKAAFYTGESIAAFAAFNPISGAGFALAAAHQAVVAGGALAGGVGGGGGGGGGKSGGGPQERLTSSLPAVATAQPRETGMTINVNTLSYVSPEDARRIATAEARQATSTVGGRK